MTKSVTGLHYQSFDLAAEMNMASQAVHFAFACRLNRYDTTAGSS